MIRLTILFDNYSQLEKIPKLWGFSCFAETPGGTFLFDTGSNGRILLQNTGIVGVDLRKAEVVLLSHPHWDHTGGIDSVLELHPDMRLFVPSSLSPRFVRDLNRLSGGVTVVRNNPVQILPHVWSTGVMGEIGEQAAVIESDKGLVVVTGCAHPGIVEIAERAVDMLQRPLYLLMGGFHLMHSDKREILSVAEKLKHLNVQYVCPTHCSGDAAMGIFEKCFGKRYIQGGVGKRIEI
jgi:7,8-dihydropterin-6-yl-methyl-4-(beta-D-ribofuranosyl)aminobenzene 5'-phosphate synthase